MKISRRRCAKSKRFWTIGRLLRVVAMREIPNRLRQASYCFLRAILVLHLLATRRQTLTYRVVSSERSSSPISFGGDGWRNIYQHSKQEASGTTRRETCVSATSSWSPTTAGLADSGRWGSLLSSTTAETSSSDRRASSADTVPRCGPSPSYVSLKPLCEYYSLTLWTNTIVFPFFVLVISLSKSNVSCSCNASHRSRIGGLLDTFDSHSINTVFS